MEHQTDKHVSEGTSCPLGASLASDGVNFAIYSRKAKQVFLLLFNAPNEAPSDVIEIKNHKNHVWHTFVHNIVAGQLYGYKMCGDYNPGRGLYFNENKLLMDPYAKAVTGKFNNTNDVLLPFDQEILIKNSYDNTTIVPKSIVMDDYFDWQGDSTPAIPIEELIIYETHVKSFTAHPSSGVKNPGTYLGFIEKIPYLKELGINAVELLPVHESYTNETLLSRGLTDYWGYNSIGFFAPELSYSSRAYAGCQVNEFKTLVKELHKARIEVILDVVYNHTGEGNERGPSICFKGIDNLTYYKLEKKGGQSIVPFHNASGCGNTIKADNPIARKMIIDSLHYWVKEMHVDGFRFDLATILGKRRYKFDRNSKFFRMLRSDPVLKNVKLIAEPWDLTTYQVGNFPESWSEWNDKFRDVSRRFLKGDEGQVQHVAYRVTGSSDLYGDDNRSPYNSINFITAHDGFTLYDLYSYNNKRNLPNLENNNDGANENHSWNCGVEGDVTYKNIINLRKQMMKNAFCLLFFSSGTSMMLGGDEFMRTQAGNNNAYCQDNEINWYDWNFIYKNKEMLTFCKRAIDFRKRHPILRRKRFFTGKDTNGDSVPDIMWYADNLNSPPWHDERLKFICYQLDGSEIISSQADYLLFIIYNADTAAHLIEIPRHDSIVWYRVVDTSLPGGNDFLPSGMEVEIDPKYFYQANPRSTILLLGKPT